MTHPLVKLVSRFRRLFLNAGTPVVLFGLAGCSAAAPAAEPVPAPRPAGSPTAALQTTGAQVAGWGLVIHGGAGTIDRGSMTAEQEAQYRAKLSEALLAGHRMLESGGSSLDAVQAAINIMEDSPLFNAGKGAVFTSEGTNELDAAIMDGRTLQAGAVAGVKHVKNPINLARLVMEQSPHVMMAGEGAETFARQHGIEMVPAEYFRTESRWRSLQRAREAEARDSAARPGAAGDDEVLERKFGTVGAVALDRSGNLAAGTSTGGMTNKKFGRIGDAPIIGAGTYANQNCAVSATGHGEYFMRAVVAHDICAIMRYQRIPLVDAADGVVMGTLVDLGGTGGVIAMDGEGNIAMPFNTSGMYRGFIHADRTPTVEIYRD